jgi:hypothetical protein
VLHAKGIADTPQRPRRTKEIPEFAGAAEVGRMGEIVLCDSFASPDMQADHQKRTQPEDDVCPDHILM